MRRTKINAKRCEAHKAKKAWPYVVRCDSTATHRVVIYVYDEVDPWEGDVCTFHLNQAIKDETVESMESTPIPQLAT